MSTPYDDLLTTPLNTQVVGSKIVPFDSIDSTNEYVLDHGEHGMVVVADRQTAGRGRLGRTWFSAPGLGLWFTVALKDITKGLTFAAALAVRDAVADRCALTIKWPNDLLYNGKKVCGILVEHRQGMTAVGIGLNVHHSRDDFPPELREKAGSLQSEVGGTWDRADLLRRILTHLDQNVILLESEGFDAIRDPWAQACNLIGREIRCGEVTGRVTEIDRDGALIVAAGDETHTIHSGDIEVLDRD